MSWDQLREQFPVTRRWVFLDHAAVAATPVPTRQVLIEWASDLCENGVASWGNWYQRVEQVRALAGRLINTPPHNIAFIKNTSEGIGFVAEGFPWQPGENVILSADEYPSNVYPWMNLARRGVEVRMIPSVGPRVPVDALRAAIDARTRMITISSVEFATGYRNDLDLIGTLCRELGVFFFVDAIQGLGMFPIDVQQTPIDFLSADSHKWLLGPEGAGIFFCRQELVDLLHPIAVGWNSVIDCFAFSRIDFRLKPHAGRWESGTLNVGGIVAMGESMRLLLDLGMKQVEERILDLTDYLCDRCHTKGIEVFSSRQSAERSGIVSLVVSGADPVAVVARCREAGVVINQRAGRLRISPHCYNNHQEIDRLLDILV